MFESTVFAIALRRLRDASEAAELTQDVLIQAMRKLPQLREPERFPGWLRRITVRLAINRAVRRPPGVHRAILRCSARLVPSADRRWMKS